LLKILNKKSIKYKLRKKTIENLKKILGMRGEGTKESPIVIDDLGDVVVEISLVINGLYIVLKNLTISKLSIAGSQHVVIEECFIADLKLRESKNLTFRSNTILRIEQILCRSCVYENNSILQKEYSKLINNAHERREFFFIWILLGVGMLFTYIGLNSLIASYYNYVSIIMLLSGISYSIAMIIMINRHYQTNKISPNRYDDFSFQEIEAISNTSIKIV